MLARFLVRYPHVPPDRLVGQHDPLLTCLPVTCAQAPVEERRRDRKERRKISRSDHFRVPANYLLNFSYERPQHDWSAPARRRGPVVEFKKERFLQAKYLTCPPPSTHASPLTFPSPSYRFVVNAQGNYLRHLYETDQLVEWDGEPST